MIYPLPVKKFIILNRYQFKYFLTLIIKRFPYLKSAPNSSLKDLMSRSIARLI